MNSSDVIKKYFTLNLLPKTVSMNVDVFESALELTSYEFEREFEYTGEFKTILGSAHSTINVTRPNSESIIKGGAKKSLKLQANLKDTGVDK